MEVLRRDQTMERWDAWWNALHKEWFKLEVRQDYTGEDDCPSLRAWVDGERKRSLELLDMQAAQSRWRQRCLRTSSAGILLRRVRVVDWPLQPYTAWEMEYYRRVNIPGGEQVLFVDRDQVAGLDLPDGDIRMFDDKRLLVGTYDETGRLVTDALYDTVQGDDITDFLRLKDTVLALGRPALGQGPEWLH